MRRILILLTAIVIIMVINGAIYQKEQLRASGTTLLLELAPRDPRSLIQGDYMVLRYQIAEWLEEQHVINSHEGNLVVEQDNQHVAHFKSIYSGQTPLAANQHLLHFRQHDSQIYLGAESFFFQEGQAHYYEKARYGELRVNAAGESILIGLRDAELKPLGP